MSNFAQRILAAPNVPVLIVRIKDPDLLDVKSAEDKKTWHSRDDKDKVEWLVKMGAIKHSGVTLKIGNNSFRDRVDFNAAYKKPFTATFKIAPRRGYTLIYIQLN